MHKVCVCVCLAVWNLHFTIVGLNCMYALELYNCSKLRIGAVDNCMVLGISQFAIVSSVVFVQVKPFTNMCKNEVLLGMRPSELGVLAFV